MNDEGRADDSDEFVRRYGSVVYNLALRLTGNAADAADLAQESLIKALKGLPAFRGGNKSVWVYRITVNAWKNMLRANSYRRALRFFSTDGEGVSSEPTDVAAREPGPEESASAADEKALIERALALLSPGERAALVLRELDGRSYEEISEVLNLPLGTVKSRLARARAMLAEVLSEVKNDAS